MNHFCLSGAHLKLDLTRCERSCQKLPGPLLFQDLVDLLGYLRR
jgi:hypothetical protein